MKTVFKIVISSGIWIALSFSQVLCMWCILDKLAMTTDSCVLHDNISQYVMFGLNCYCCSGSHTRVHTLCIRHFESLLLEPLETVQQPIFHCSLDCTLMASSASGATRSMDDQRSGEQTTPASSPRGVKRGPTIDEVRVHRSLNSNYIIQTLYRHFVYIKLPVQSQ